MDFWQIIFVRIAGKPVNRAFVRILKRAKNFKFGSGADVFGILR